MRVLRHIPRHPVWALLVVALITAAALHQIVDLRTGEVHIQVDPSTDRLLPEGHESKQFYDRVRRLFGSDETLLLALVTDDIFTADRLARIRRITERIERLDGVDHVLSLTNAINLRGVGDDIEIAPFVDEIPESAEDLAELRREVLGNPIYGGSLVARGGGTSAILVYFSDMTNTEYRESGLNSRVIEISEEEAGDEDVWVTGGPHLQAETARILLADGVRLPIFILAVLAVVLWLFFRSVAGIVLPLATIVVALIWTLGIAVGLDHTLNAVTTLIPPLLTTLGLSYSVHVVAEYYETASEADSTEDPVEAALGSVTLPVSLTGLTTAIGFATLGLSPLGAVREFGLLAVTGTLCTVVASLSFTPAALALLRPKAGTSAQTPRTDRLIDRIAQFDRSNRRPIFVAAAAIFLLAMVGLSQLRVGTEQIGKFSPDAPVRVHFEAVNEHLEGANPFTVVVETGESDAFKEPSNLLQVADLQRWLEEQPEIGGTTSLVDYLALINRAFHENDPAHLAVPTNRRMVSQLLFFGASDELDSFVDAPYRTVAIQVRARVVDSDDITALVDRIEQRLAELPEHLIGKVTGTSVVFSQALDEVIWGQATSVITALGIIYLILAAMFVSPRIGLVALIPNVLPVAVYFGALGLSGVRLNPGTSLIAPMVIGIAVDDTIHYFARFIREARSLGSERLATVAALRGVGRPVTYTSTALVAGFLVLTLSELRTQVELGMLAAFALSFAWLTDMLLTPALCAGLRIVTLWDVLALDLGHDPQHSISLFHGLTAPQARIVALMGRTLSVRGGERLFHSGEPGGALYVVIDGSLRASVEREGRTVELAIHSRGEVIGEVGLFGENRSADVDVVDDARLLRLSADAFAQLAKRYPRISSIVFRNLNEALASRLARLTMEFR